MVIILYKILVTTAFDIVVLVVIYDSITIKWGCQE